MNKRPPGSTSAASRKATQRRAEKASSIHGISVEDLPYFINWFLKECKFRNHSATTLREEENVLNKFLRYLEEEKIEFCRPLDVSEFLLHVRGGGMQRGGRWGQQQPYQVRPRTERNYWSYLRTFFNWLNETEPDIAFPFEKCKPPIGRSDQITPFTSEQLQALFRAAKRTTNPRRDEAIIYFLLDTGVRASELCAIKRQDLDLGGYRCTVLGKGNKHRVVTFGQDTNKALWRYLQERSRDHEYPRQETEPLFSSARGTLAGDPLTRAGLLQLIERLGKAAGVQGVRCSPHTFRHTFAIRFLTSGGNVFTLQHLLGHTDLTMTQRYINLAQADVEAQSRRHSPVDTLKRGGASRPRSDVS